MTPLQWGCLETQIIEINTYFDVLESNGGKVR